MIFGPILSATALQESAERAIDGVAPGLTLSMGYLTRYLDELAAAYLVSAWRRSSSGGIEYTVPFDLVLVTLESGRLLARRTIRAKELGLYAGRELPEELDEYLPGSTPALRPTAHEFIVENTARVWQLFRDSPQVTESQRDFVRIYQRARNTSLFVRDHVFQEALHPAFHRWLADA